MGVSYPGQSSKCAKVTTLGPRTLEHFREKVWRVGANQESKEKQGRLKACNMDRLVAYASQNRV